MPKPEKRIFCPYSMPRSYKVGDRVYCSKRKLYGTIYSISNYGYFDFQSLNGEIWYGTDSDSDHSMVPITEEEFVSAEVLSA